MSQNIVETEYQSSLTIRGTCHQDFQNVAETFAINFDKYNEIGSSLSVIVQSELISISIFLQYPAKASSIELSTTS